MKSIKRKLIPFRNVKGFAGVFVPGARPVWVICGAKCYVRVLPMGGEDGIKAFTQFHNVNCVHGFLYSNVEVRFSFLIWKRRSFRLTVIEDVYERKRNRVSVNYILHG